jgi:hypothetical protein
MENLFPGFIAWAMSNYAYYLLTWISGGLICSLSLVCVIIYAYDNRNRGKLWNMIHKIFKTMEKD